MRSITDVFSLNSPGLSAIKKQEGETATMALMVILLKSVIEFFNVGKSMNDLQVVETAKLIISEFYFLKVEDLKLCFDGMKTGKYLPNGQLFDRLDGGIFLHSLKMYSEERIALAEIASAESHKKLLETESEELFVLMVDSNYISEVADEYVEEERKDAATKYKFGHAIALKNWFIKYHYQDTPDKVRIINANKSDIGLMDFIKEKAPQLVSPKQKYKDAMVEYERRKKKILEDEVFTDFEKHNEIRKLSGLLPHNKPEYEQYLKTYKSKKK